MADAARDQRETTLALRGDVEEPGADAGGPAPYRGKDFDELKAKLEAADAEVKRLNQVNFELLNAQHDAVLAKLSQNECAKQALWDFAEVAGDEDEIRHDRSVREALLTESQIKKQGLLERLAQKQNAGTRRARGGVDLGGPGPGHYIAIAELKVALGKLEVKLEAAQTENARLHQLNLELVTARHDALLSEVARPKKRARVEDGNVAADEAKPAMQAACECPVEEAEDRYMQLKSDFLVTQREIEMLGTLDRTAQEQNHLTRNGLGGVDAGGPGPGHYVEMAVLKGTVGKLEIKLAAAQKEIARLNEALQDVLRTRLDSAVAELAASLAQKKRSRVDDDAAANL
ncbi:unnamed protein product [Pelagomonas calceolata]|uniref:Uncharacterized protein n=1 Tax=Pelagomonas calceolata TaxID=35677 RepID=A0A7S3ZM20_9STRA|nr:unnamed protein product [Pelagomonas calceolata]CAH0375524.1 unnamed protein product [Pelagomonas calceolata]|mmetsp:Transcript_21945/g.61752  ORF Transcript_21945/g.61752 Transcript_21945/m.61752 type:complete len:345 (+) Transcript_21945:113-1147(+)